MPKMYLLLLKKICKNVNDLLNLFCFRSVSFSLPFSTLSPTSSSQDTRENQVSRHIVIKALILMPSGLGMVHGYMVPIGIVSIFSMPVVEASSCLVLRALKITSRESDYSQGHLLRPEPFFITILMFN